MLAEFVSRIPYAAAPDNWPTHVAGHPPGALLFFVLLARVGLGGDFAAGLVVTALAATTAVAVLDHAARARRRDGRAPCGAVPGAEPGRGLMAVSADAAVRGRRRLGPGARWRGPRRGAGPGPRGRGPGRSRAGLLLGCCVLLSYGLPLLGCSPSRCWPRPAPGARCRSPRRPPLASCWRWCRFGFRLVGGLPRAHERYWDGLAADRPVAYWAWGNLAALAVSAGLLVAAGLAAAAVALRARGGVAALRPGRPDRDRVRPVLLLAGAALLRSWSRTRPG